MLKPKVRSLSAVGIIYLVSDPSQVLVSLNRRDTSPRVFQWTLGLLGGVWKGKLAEADANPLSTFKRSVEGDLGISFKRAEPYQYGKDDGGFTREESQMFLDFRKAVVNKAVPWRDYLVSIDQAVLGSVPGGHESPYESLVSYHLVGLDDSEWLFLQKTLERFENVSRSGLCLTATYQDIVARGQAFGFGHETAMLYFWKEHGHTGALQIKRLLSTPAREQGRPLSSYKEYVSTYDFEQKP